MTDTTEHSDGWSEDNPDTTTTDTTTDSGQNTTEPDDQPDEGARPGREARYRTRARDAESALAVAQARLEKFRTVDAERHAAAHLADPSDLWTLGVSLADVLGADGEVDQQLVEDAAERIATTRPGLRPKQVEMGQGRRGTRGGSGTSWSSVLRGTG